MPLDHHTLQQGEAHLFASLVSTAFDTAELAAKNTTGNVALLSGRQAACLAQAKQRTLWSSYFEVGGYDWRLLVYPSGDSQALPGYISLYVQVSAATCSTLNLQGILHLQTLSVLLVFLRLAAGMCPVWAAAGSRADQRGRPPAPGGSAAALAAAMPLDAGSV